MATARTIDGLQYHGPEKTAVAIASNAASVAVTFDVAYQFTPEVKVIKPRGAAGAYSATSVTKTGFTITVASETDADFDGDTVTVYWFAMERN